MVERNSREKQNLTVTNILPVQHVKAFREAAAGFGIKITILATSGENYEEWRSDKPANQPEENYFYSGRVPEGHVQVEIASTSGNFSPFYDRAAKVLARIQDSKIKAQSK